MPTYEYACKDCGHQFEVVQSFSDDALTVCPSCDGALRKVFSAAGIIFKGSGWHIKDYAGASGGTASNGGGDDGAAGGGSSDSPDRGSSGSSSAPDTGAAGSDPKPSATSSSPSSSTAASGSD